MASLPVGDGTSGVMAVSGCVKSFAQAVELSDEEFRKRERLFAGNAEEIAKFCDPGRNASSFRSCQEAASSALHALLALALRGDRVESRLAGFEALARVMFNVSENAAIVASSDQCVPAVEHALRPVTEMLQQQEHIAALLLVQGLAAAVPEAPCITALLPHVVELATGNQEGYPACGAVRTLCLEVLVSCALASSRKRQVAKLLPARALDALLGDVDADRSMPMGLLIACLCDATLHDDQGPTDITFGEHGSDFWQHTSFFASLADCLAAAQQGEEWPPGSGLYHRAWKLASACRQLALGGYAANLEACAPALIAIVEQRASGAEIGADEATASRLAVFALRGLCFVEGAVVKMRESSALPEALRQLEAEEESARFLLQFLEGGPLPPAIEAGAAQDNPPAG